MRLLLSSILLLAGLLLHAGELQLTVLAPQHAGRPVFLSVHSDPFTRNTQEIARAVLDRNGKAVLTVAITGTQRGRLRVDDDQGQLYLRAGTLTVRMLPPEAGTVKKFGGDTPVPLQFEDVSPLEVNALTSDLYERLDDYLATSVTGGRATDGKLIVERDVQDSAATALFMEKLQRFYAEVNDPWFQHEVLFGCASLFVGPNANDRALYERFLAGKTLHYDSPEQMRFVRSFYEGHLMRGPFRKNDLGLRRAVAEGDGAAVGALLAANDLLKDPRINELVMLLELKDNYHNPLLDRAGIRSILERTAARSAYPEHRPIAAALLHDLVFMTKGTAFPALRLTDSKGDTVGAELWSTGPTLIILTAGWCTICEQEMIALDQLHRDFGAAVRFITIDLEDSATYQRYVAANQRPWPVLNGGDDRSVMGALRAVSIPMFYLLEDGKLTMDHVPSPSRGLPALLHPYAVKARERDRIKLFEPAPPKRR